MANKLESILAGVTVVGLAASVGCGSRPVNTSHAQQPSSMNMILKKQQVHGVVAGRRGITYGHEDELAFIQIYDVFTPEGLVRVGKKFSTKGAPKAPEYIFKIGDAVDIQFGEISMGGQQQFNEIGTLLGGVYGIKSYEIK